MAYKQEAAQRKEGREAVKSTFYGMLKRHDWRKVKPGARSPKGDPELQEEFKKKRSKFIWQKLA